MDTTTEDTSSPTVRLCKHPQCQKPLFRRKGEAASSFKKRSHCNSTCFKTNPNLRKAQSDAFAAIREAHRKDCVICEKTFHRNKNESITVFDERPTCSRQCAAEKRSREFKEEVLKHPKTCANEECGKLFYRRLRSETKEKFAIRETCSIQCNNAKRKQKNAHKWQNKPRRPSSSSSSRKKAATVSTLPPTSDCPVDIPDAPKVKSDTVVVWRPESWGGPIVRKVS